MRITFTQQHPDTVTIGDLRIWWIPQVPMKPFYVYVRNIAEARLLLDALADYDAFQFANRIKPDYSNVGGLQVYEGDSEGDGWCDWYDDEDDDIDHEKYCRRS